MAVDSKGRGFKLHIPSFHLCRPKVQSAGRSGVINKISSASKTYPDDDNFAWIQQDKWHVVAKLRPRDDYCSCKKYEQTLSPPRRKIDLTKEEHVMRNKARTRVKYRHHRGDSEQQPLLITPERHDVYKGCVDHDGKNRRFAMSGDFLAVVKTSSNPYADFKMSMLEMMMLMDPEDELQKLLNCFLSLNSIHHYPTIIRAFSDILSLF